MVIKRVWAVLIALVLGAVGCGGGGDSAAQSETTSPQETTTTQAELTLEQVRLELKDAGCEAEGAQGRYGGMGQLGLRVYKDQVSTCGQAVEDALISLGFNDRQMAALTPSAFFGESSESAPSEVDFLTVDDRYRVEMNNFAFIDFLAFVIYDQENLPLSS